jgi:hypothetical protein
MPEINAYYASHGDSVLVVSWVRAGWCAARDAVQGGLAAI